MEIRKTTEEALRTTIEEQIVLETTKLQRLEREAHQWMQQVIPNLEKSRYHLHTDETTYRDCRGEGPIYGSQHGYDSRSLHIRKYVDLIKPDCTHHRNPEDFAKLDRFPTSPRSDSPSHCRSLCTEKTDHQNS